MTTRGCCVRDCEQPFHKKGFCFTHYQELRTCAVEGCAKPLYAKRMCEAHYCYNLRQGATSSLRSPLTLVCRECGCTLHPKCHGWCDTHYNYHKRRDELPIPLRRCSVKGCELPHSGKGYCIQHYRRFVNGSDVTTLIKHNTREFRTGSINPDGYLVVQRQGHPNAASQGAIFEHRFLVSEYLGRPLLPRENVHHRNGIRTENTVGPCVLQNQCICEGQRHNLELWTKSQPSGQRVADKVRWAQEILALYVNGVQ